MMQRRIMRSGSSFGAVRLVALISGMEHNQSFIDG
jgi:hypothetical protein